MKTRISIEINDDSNAADVCREVANLIEEGYYGGFVGCADVSWKVTDSEELD